MVSSACPSRTISCALRTFVSTEVAMALAATNAIDVPPVVINLAVIDSTAMDTVAAIDTLAAAIDTATIDSATIDLAATYAATDTAMDAAAMDAVDVVVGALPLLPKHVIRLEATMYSPT